MNKRGYDLERFIQAQEHSYDRALEEIRNGKKLSHWMWYIFPQLRWLAKSDISELYGISGLEEAGAYLDDPILGKRLIEISEALLKLQGKDAALIFGWPDVRKLCSCMTLFAELERTDPVFQNVIDVYFDGKKDWRTMHFLQMAELNYEELIFSEILEIQDILELPYKRKTEYRIYQFSPLHPLIKGMMGINYGISNRALDISSDDAYRVFDFLCHPANRIMAGNLTETQLCLIAQYENDIDRICEEYKTEKENFSLLKKQIQKEEDAKWKKYWDHFDTLPDRIRSIVYYEFCKIRQNRSTSGFHGLSANRSAPFSCCGWADCGEPFSGVGFHINHECFNGRDVQLYYIDDDMVNHGSAVNKDHWQKMLNEIAEYSSGLSDIRCETRREEKYFLFRGNWEKGGEFPEIRFRLDPSKIRDTVSFCGRKIPTKATGGYIFVLPRAGEFYCELGEIIDGRHVPLHIDDFCLK